jgi:hypothetical protein
VRVTVAYSVVLAVVATTLLALGPRAQDSAVSHMSTNLHNLARGHLDTLLSSAFVTDDSQIYASLPGLVCLMACAELLWRSRFLVLAFALGHIGATLIVAVGLVAAIRWGWQPISVARDSDVGISYGAAAVLGTLTAAIPPRVRAAWIGWWLAVALTVAETGGDFTSAGHAVALTLGILLSTRLPAVEHWTPVRVVLLAGGVVFGYLVLTGMSLLTAPAAGLAGALIALTGQWAARQWRNVRVKPRHDWVVPAAASAGDPMPSSAGVPTVAPAGGSSAAPAGVSTAVAGGTSSS